MYGNFQARKGRAAIFFLAQVLTSRSLFSRLFFLSQNTSVFTELIYDKVHTFLHLMESIILHDSGNMKTLVMHHSKLLSFSSIVPILND